MTVIDRLTCGLAVLVLSTFCVCPAFAQSEEQTVRVATFNTSLNRDEAGQLKRDLSNGDDKQARAIAEIIQRVRPHVLLLNEFDYDPGGDSVRLFSDNYLQVAQNGQRAIEYSYSYTAGVNTGVLSGLDYDNNGSKTDPTDAYGFGRFPGQYGMVILSRFPIEKEQVRTFQKLLWKQMPTAMLPRNPENDKPYYSADVLEKFRISSKSHWDVPIRIGERTLHFLVCHPTPPAFDGPERRNQLRNHDEIRLFADYLSPKTSTYIKDDMGRVGGLMTNQSFVIAGDLNADPVDGASENHAVRQLLNHPRVNSARAPQSKGAVEAATTQGKANLTQKGDATTDTADFGDRTTGNLRVDYVLPSKDLTVQSSGVFWPATTDPHATLIKASDHRMVWVDLKFK